MQQNKASELDILDRHLPVFGHHFLEASAGTGKTFAIEHFVLRLLLESDEPLLLNQILVVTFTRAAARELKARIRSNLIAACDQMRSGKAQHDYLKAILEEGGCKASKSIRRIEDALACFDSAQIFTIHGFCYRALSEFAFEAGASFEINDPDDSHHFSVVEEAVQDFLLQKMQRPDFSPGQAALLLNYFRKNPQRLKARLASLVNQDKEIAPAPTFSESLKTWQHALGQFCKVSKEALIADWNLLASQYKQMGHERFSHQMQILGRMLEDKQCTANEFDQLLKEKELFLDKMDSGNKKVRAKMLDSSALHYPGLLEQLRKSLLPIAAKARDPLQILLRLARACRQDVMPRLQDGDALTPDALLQKMHQTLHEEKFADKIRTRYRAAIIDEFQDTDPLQWEIFKTLFIGHMRSVCLVGDPKQSIYAFRNADLYTYLKAADVLGEKSRKYLDTNYRSTPALVNALNRLFASERTKGWMSLPHLGISLDVIAVKAGKEAQEADDLGSVHFFAAEAEKSKRSGRWPSETLEKTAFFPYIAQEVLGRKHEGPWSQFAILVKDRYQAQRLWEFLKSCHIPSVIRKSGALNESDAFMALYELVDAIRCPSDLSRLKKFLGGPLVGWSHEQLSGSFDKEELREAKEKALLLQDLLHQSGFSPFFREFLTSAWGSNLSVEERLLSQGSLDLYCDLHQLAEMIVEVAWAKKRVSEEWISLLDEMAAASMEEEGRLKRRIGSDEDAVQILTMHMSKGLEFDVVFALGVASSHSLRDEIAVQKEGRGEIVALAWDDPACCQAIREIDAEKLRQLYVALTRAKKRVYIPLAFDIKKSSAGAGQSSPIELYFAAAALPSFDFDHVEAFLNEIKEGASITLSRVERAPLVSVPAKKQIMLDILPKELKPFSLEPIVSYSSLVKKADFEGSLVQKLEKTDEKGSILNMPLGAQTGLIFHAIMEKLFHQGLHFFPQQKRIADLIEKQTVNTALYPWQEALFETIWDLLHMPLKGFCLSEIPPVQIQEEMEFLFPFEKGLMKGFADLVFEWRKKYYLLDWKTNYLGALAQDYSSENVTKSMEQHDYFLQASIYGEALKRYVKLFDKRPFSECFGGIFYVFVRGKAVYYIDSAG